MEDFLLIAVAVGVALVFGILIIANKATKCEPGKVEPCVWNSPYTNQREVGKQICGTDSRWGNCHPLCEE